MGFTLPAAPPSNETTVFVAFGSWYATEFP